MSNPKRRKRMAGLAPKSVEKVEPAPVVEEVKEAIKVEVTEKRILIFRFFDF